MLGWEAQRLACLTCELAVGGSIRGCEKLFFPGNVLPLIYDTCKKKGNEWLGKRIFFSAGERNPGDAYEAVLYGLSCLSVVNSQFEEKQQ